MTDQHICHLHFATTSWARSYTLKFGSESCFTQHWHLLCHLLQHLSTILSTIPNILSGKKYLVHYSKQSISFQAQSMFKCLGFSFSKTQQCTLFQGFLSSKTYSLKGKPKCSSGIPFILVQLFRRRILSQFSLGEQLKMFGTRIHN